MKRNLMLAGMAGSLLALGVLFGCGSSSTTPQNTVIGVWATTGVTTNGTTYAQRDRLARPVVNEVFASVAGNRHKTNDEDNPTNDANELAKDIDNFMTNTAKRSRQITDVVKSVLVPDVLKADLSQSAPAAYLGVETGGATGGKFGGRKLTDDVVDISLGVVFGKTIPNLGLAADDGKEITALTSDNVGPGGKQFTNTFPYIGAPR